MIYILVVWIIINILSSFINAESEFSLIVFFGVTMKVLMPYFLIKIIGPSFFDKLIQYVYVLVLISTTLYLFDALTPELFSSYAKYFNSITDSEQLMNGGWYIFVYMHNAWAFLTKAHIVYRNSGFMWEPGGYAMILILVLSYRLIINNLKLDKFSIIFIIAIVTTFSTSGILALLMLIGAYFISLGKRNEFLFMLLLPFFIFLIYELYNTVFISSKIIGYYNLIDYHYTHHIYDKMERVNRFGILKYNIEQALFWPFGNGIFNSTYLIDKYGYVFSGPNTFAAILYKWGIIGVYVYTLFIFRFYKLFNNSKKTTIFFSIALAIVLFSNPAELKPIAFAPFYFYLIFRNKPGELIISE